MNIDSGSVPPPAGDKPPEPHKPIPTEPADHVFWNMQLTKAQYQQASSTFYRDISNQLQKVMKHAIEAQKKAWRDENG